MSAVKVEGLRKEYGRRRVVAAIAHLDLEIREGELLVLLGASGSGKTTTLRCIGGLETPTAGLIQISGKTVFDARNQTNVPVHRRDIGIVFQSYALWPHMTARQNVGYPLRARRTGSSRSWADRVARTLKAVQCDQLADRYPAQLSGGQQQRVALARALVSEPALMLLDEPLSNLDAVLRTELRSEIRELHRRLGFTGVYVTHDQTEAFNLADRVGVMRDGLLDQLGTPQEVYGNPSSVQVAELVGLRNRVDLNRRGGRWHSAAGPVDGFSVEGDANNVQLRLRPDRVLLTRTSPAAAADKWTTVGKGQVTESMFSGSTWDTVVRLGEDRLLVSHDGDERYRPGDTVIVGFNRRDARLYADDRLVPTSAIRPGEEATR